MEQPKSPSIDELNKMYSEGESVDKDLYAEQRSNVLLASGDHYAKKNSKWWNRLRDANELQSEAKLRLTKNHLHRITRTYENNIMSQAPGVTLLPNNPKELQDIKAAELNKSVWEYAKTSQHLKMKTHSWCKDFIEIGECIAKVYWDPMAGRFRGYEQAVDENGPVVDEMGQPVSSGKAVFTGDLVFERVLGFNLIRPAEAKTMHEAKWLCVRKMVHIDELKLLVGDDEDKKKKIQATQDETFFVFDGSKGNYSKSDNQGLVKEWFFRPSYDYPDGWFIIQTGEVKIDEGPLPFGVYPIVYEGFDEIQTTPRHRSIIKQLRPYIYEINRAGSKIAEHQVTLGDDKVILQNGAKVSNGPNLPGIRTLFVSGQAPTILEGRAGVQFLEYMNSQIAELYQVANIEEDSANKESGGDAFANLYRSIRDKKKFSLYGERFENFLIMLCKTYLQLAKQYFDEEMLIPRIGRSEYVNVAEFKSTEELCYQIKVEAQTEDVTTMMGRHLTFNHILQYVGSNLDPSSMGRILKSLPFQNSEDAFSDLTLNDDNATNIILALDRGSEPNVSKNDDEQYMLKRLSARQKASDFQMLSPEIQRRYDEVIAMYEQIAAEKIEAIKQAQNEFIPASGASIKCDYYIPDPTQPNRSIRATVPAEALDWLIKRLSEQGSSQEQLAMQTTQVQSEISKRVMQNKPPQQGPENPSMATPNGGLLQ